MKTGVYSNQYIKDCEAGAGRTPSVRSSQAKIIRKYTLSEILADLPDSLKIRQNPAN